MRFEFSQPFNFPNFLGENHRKLVFSWKNLKNSLYAFFKLRGRVQTTWTNEGGRGVAQMTTTLNNSYLVKVSI